MRRTTLLTAAFAIAAFFVAATPVIAMRDPGTGPASGSGMALYDYASHAPQPPRIGQNGLNNQYADGVNLYEYCKSGPIMGRDAFGLKLERNRVYSAEGQTLKDIHEDLVNNYGYTISYEEFVKQVKNAHPDAEEGVKYTDIIYWSATPPSPLPPTPPATSAPTSHTSIKNCPKRKPRPGYKATANGCGPAESNKALQAAITLLQGYGRVNFTPACNQHDLCYGKCNSDKGQCDQDFKGAMIAECLGNYGATSAWESIFTVFGPERRLAKCRAVAEAFYQAVSRWGDDAYWAAQEEACCCGE